MTNQPTAAAMKAANRIASYLELCHNISIPDVQIHRIASDIDRECKIRELMDVTNGLIRHLTIVLGEVNVKKIGAVKVGQSLLESLQESEASHD